MKGSRFRLHPLRDRTERLILVFEEEPVVSNPMIDSSDCPLTCLLVGPPPAAGSYKSDTASRFSLIIMSMTTWKTTWMLEVSVAVVKWW